MKQPVLVLGGDGFIGTQVVKALAASSWASPVVAGRRAANPQLDGFADRRVVLDARDEAALSAALQGVSGVVNCVTGNADTILDGAKALFAAGSAMSRPPRIVHLSSMAAYGSATGRVDESAPLLGDLGPYSAAKAAVEKLGAGYPDLVALRPGCVYGPGSAQWSTRIAKWLVARRIGDLGMAGDGICNLVHVGDVAAAVLRSLLKEGVEGQAFNLSGSALLTWNDYFLLFAKALGEVPIHRIHPRRLKLESKVYAVPLKLAEIAIGKLKLPLEPADAMPPSLLRFWQQEIVLDTHKVETSLDLRWTPLDQGIRQAADWFQDRRRKL